MPIAMIRNAGAPSDDAAQSVGRALPPSLPRAEAIRKLLDALGRHVSGKEILSPGALVKLVEELARILKSPPVPQESERAVARRLISALEALPTPERVLATKQYGARELAHRNVALMGRGAGSNFNAPPTDHRGSRNLPLQFALPPRLAAAEEPSPRDVVPLQAMLKKTFGAEEDLEAELADSAPAGEREETTGPKPQKAPSAAERSAQSSLSDDFGAVATSHGAERNDLEEPQTIASLTENSGEPPLPEATNERGLPATMETAEADTSHEPAANAEDLPEQIPDHAEIAGDTVADASDVDAFDSDGAYGPPRTTEGRHQVRAPSASVAERRGALPDLIRVLVQGGLDLPPITTMRGKMAAPENGEAERRELNSEPAFQERQPDTGRPRTAPRSDLPSAEFPSDNRKDRAPVGSPLVLRQSGSGEEPAMRQALALLVGLPREIIPVAVVPYPPAQEGSDDARDEAERYPREEREEAGAEAEGKGEGERREQGPESEGNPVEAPEETDAYDLYRKLGGLG